MPWWTDALVEAVRVAAVILTKASNCTALINIYKWITNTIIATAPTCDNDYEILYKQILSKWSSAQFSNSQINAKYYEVSVGV